MPWSTHLKGGVDRPSLVGITLYVATGAGGVHTFDITTGRKLWHAYVDGSSNGTVVTEGVVADVTVGAPEGSSVITTFGS